jgi:antitoxin (DNA-binding transcriptional repressor) of toxin-antitoxin stability system
MATVSIREAKNHLSKLSARAEAGEEIIIARGK